MSRTRISLWILTATMLIVTAMLLGSFAPETPVTAPFVTVTRGDIEVSVPITGRLAYAGECMAFTAVPGLVSQIYVKPGDRVAEGEALLRLDAAAYESAVSAWIAADDSAAPNDLHQTMTQTVVRAPENATVRQVLTVPHSAVMAGTPVVCLSSTQQEIRCTVAEADACRIRPGMWARLSVAGEDLGHIATVTAVGNIEVDLTTGRACAAVTLVPEQPIDLPTGAAVDADVYLDGRVGVTVLPVAAITERDTVWWVSEARCTEISVKNLLSDEMHAWVDLPEGITVAVGEFKEGQRIVEESP